MGSILTYSIEPPLGGPEGLSDVEVAGFSGPPPMMKSRMRSSLPGLGEMEPDRAAELLYLSSERGGKLEW